MPTKLEDKNNPPELGGHYDDGKPGWYSPSKIDELEKAYHSPSATDKDLPDSHPDKKQVLDDHERGLYDQPTGDSQSSKKSRLMSRLRVNKRVIFGSSVGIFAGGGFALFGLLTGPLELMHLGQILGNSSRPTSTILRYRTGSMFRNARAIQTGEIGETRVGRYGSRIFANAESQLRSAGIEISRNNISGRPTNMSIDPSRNAAFDRPSSNQSRLAIAQHFGVDPSRVTPASGGRFNISMTDTSIRQTRALTFSALAALEDGRVKTAINKRVMAKYFNVPSLFRPFQRIQSGTEDRYATRLARRQAEQDRKESKRAQLRQKYTSRIDSTRSRLSGFSLGVSSALFVTGTYCTAKSIADAIPYINFAAIIVPSMLGAADKQAIDAQIRYGDDFIIDQLGATQETFEDEDGNTIWQAEGLQALANNGRSKGGEEMPSGYYQAFSLESSSGNINAALDNIAGDIACSTAGRWVQGALGVALIFVPGPGWVARGATAAGGVALSTAVMSYVTDIILDRITEDPVELFSGPLGGNLLAYGAMAGNNLNARAMGGIELTPEQTAALNEDALRLEREELQQKSFFARVFDIGDYRSLVSRVARATQGSLSTTANRFAGALSNPFTLLTNSLTKLSSNVLADDEPYDWGFPVYGLPLEIINHPRYEDPYENAVAASEILDKELADENTDYINRALECFGVDVGRGSDGVWVVTRVQETNPTEKEYMDANCSDTSSEEWVRVMLFVLDNSIITSMDCYEGGSESCNDLGIGG